MKRKLIFCVITLSLLFICIAFSACITRFFQQRPSNNPALYSVLVCSVPGAGDRYTRAGSIEVLEIDSYGRTLFKHSQPVPIYYRYDSAPLLSYVICQKTDDRGAYYLKDINFELADGNGIDESRLQSLKERNGWEQPLEFDTAGMEYTELFTGERFDYKTNSDYFAFVIRRRSELINHQLAEYSPEDFSNEHDIVIRCFDVFEGGAIYIVALGRQTSSPEFRSCLIATYPDGTIYEKSPMWIESPYSETYHEQVKQFRNDFEVAVLEKTTNSFVGD